MKGDNDKQERENSKVVVVGTAPLVSIAKRVEPRIQMGRMHELWRGGSDTLRMLADWLCQNKTNKNTMQIYLSVYIITNG